MPYKPTPEEIALDLPGASANSDMKSQLLLVAEILRLFTDAEHGLTADDIREVVGIRTTPTAAKVRDDIHSLAANAPFGMEVTIPSRGENSGFRCRKAFLTSEQARLCINVVRTCKFLTRRQRDDICEALFGMVSYYQQDSIARSVVVDERDLPQGPEIDVFAAAEAFSSALGKNRMLCFKYAVRGLDGLNHYSRNPIDGSEVLEETPIALIFSFGNYYAEMWSGGAEGGRRMLRRLDRMVAPKVSEAEAVASSAIDLLRTTVQERIGQTFDMYGECIARDLFLRANAWAARYVYDRFGHGVSFEYVGEEDGTLCGYTYIRIRPSPTFYRWLFGMDGQITIAKPDSAMWEASFRRHGLDPLKSHEELLQDYEAAIEGMRRQISRSAEVYGWMLCDTR